MSNWFALDFTDGTQLKTALYPKVVTLYLVCTFVTHTVTYENVLSSENIILTELISFSFQLLEHNTLPGEEWF